MQLGESLLAGGIITQEILKRELERSGKGTTKMGKALMACGFPSQSDLIQIIARTIRIPNVQLSRVKISQDVVGLIPKDVAKAHKVLALEKIGDILVVVTPNISSTEAFATVRRETGCMMAPIRCSEDGFNEAVERFYQGVSAKQSSGRSSGSSSGRASKQAEAKKDSSRVKQQASTANAGHKTGQDAGPFDPDVFVPMEATDHEFSGTTALNGGAFYDVCSIWEQHFTQSGPISAEALE